MQVCGLNACAQHDKEAEKDPHSLWEVLSHCPNVRRHFGGDAKKSRQMVARLKKAGLWQRVRSSELLKEQRRRHRIAKHLEWDRANHAKRMAKQQQYTVATLVRKGVVRPPKLKLELDESAVLAFDTETSGLSASDVPIQLGYVLKVRGQVALERSVILKYHRHIEINERAEEIHGISSADMAASPHDAATEIAKLVKLMHDVRSAGGVVIAHNAPFDRRMLKQGLPGIEEAPVTCTLQLARRETGLTKGLKLERLYKQLVPEEAAAGGPKAHDALGDAKMCLAVYENRARLKSL